MEDRLEAPASAAGTGVGSGAVEDSLDHLPAEMQRRFRLYYLALNGDLKGLMKTMWDENASRYERMIGRIAASSKQALSGWVGFNPNLSKDMDVFLDKCRSPDFHVALVGTIKTGKSTLMNSILGVKLASVAVTPETATITRFRKVAGKFTIKLTFYTHDEWSELWNSVERSQEDAQRRAKPGSTPFFEEFRRHNADAVKDRWIGHTPESKEFDSCDELREEIAQWTSSKHATHYFVKNVDVGLPNCDLPEGVVFVDTPGLDDPVEYRSRLTKEYSARANAVLYCIKCDAITGSELGRLFGIYDHAGAHPEKVFVVATQLDKLNDPLSDWVDLQHHWAGNLINRGHFKDYESAQKNIFCVSAVLYDELAKFDPRSETASTLLVRMALSFGVRESSIAEKVPELVGRSGLQLLKDRLRKDILSNHRKMYLQELSESYRDLRKQIVSHCETVKAEREDSLVVMNQDEQQRRENAAEKKDKLQHAEAELVELQGALGKIKTSLQNEADRLIAELKEMKQKIKNPGKA